MDMQALVSILTLIVLVIGGLLGALHRTISRQRDRINDLERRVLTREDIELVRNFLEARSLWPRDTKSGGTD